LTTSPPSRIAAVAVTLACAPTRARVAEADHVLEREPALIRRRWFSTGSCPHRVGEDTCPVR
jgi:hypothetical protein